jgi:hypothetical protein
MIDSEFFIRLKVPQFRRRATQIETRVEQIRTYLFTKEKEKEE